MTELFQDFLINMVIVVCLICIDWYIEKKKGL
jgi:hypothetical protein